MWTNVVVSSLKNSATKMLSIDITSRKASRSNHRKTDFASLKNSAAKMLSIDMSSRKASWSNYRKTDQFQGTLLYFFFSLFLAANDRRASRRSGTIRPAEDQES
jgi:hypothetical protein